MTTKYVWRSAMKDEYIYFDSRRNAIFYFMHRGGSDWGRVLKVEVGETDEGRRKEKVVDRYVVDDNEANAMVKGFIRHGALGKVT